MISWSLSFVCLSHGRIGMVEQDDIFANVVSINKLP